ncbi:heterokaryon incompatibility protein [Rutstroemia sp. NJR-2017a BBW]|nr:heterokaryon incompatibility protein [Rutstroemia sp. NJR-2017a BBW]
MSHYTYQPLDQPKSQIRLLQLHSGRGRIRCSLITVDLESASRLAYEPLSYCWGSQKNPKSIFLGHSKFAVGRNLYHALKRLRYRNNVRVLWCDAICIDQSNIQEKNHQIPMMKRIYENGIRTIAWLGEDSFRLVGSQVFPMLQELAAFSGQALATTNRPHNRQIFSIFKSFADFSPPEPTTKINFYHWREFLSKGADENISLFRKIQMTIYVASGLQAYHHVRIKYNTDQFFSRSWFNRAWIKQEVAVSPHITVVLGKNSIDWDIIVQASRASIEGWGYGFSNLLTERRSYQERWYPGLADILCSTLDCDATDHRDRLYAVLGLLKPGENLGENFEVDYTINPVHLFEGLTRLSLQSTTNPNHLLLGGRDPQMPDSCLIQHPSWVWSRVNSPTQRRCYMPLWRSPYGQASLDSAAAPIFSGDGRTLEYMGYILDVVSELGVVLEPRSHPVLTIGSVYRTLHSYLKWRLFAKIDTATLYPHSSLTRKQAFYTLLFFDKMLPILEQKYVQDMLDNMEEYDKDMLRFLRFSQKLDSEKCSRIYNRIRFHTNMVVRLVWTSFFCKLGRRLGRLMVLCSPWHVQRRIMLSEQGYLGLITQDARLGDRIALIKGIRVPVVLRSSGGKWELVCEMYLLGAMQGELWDESKCHPVLIE